MKKRKKWELCIGGVISFGLVFLAVLALFYVLRSYYLLLFLLAMTGMAIVSVRRTFALADDLRIHTAMSPERVLRMGEIEVVLRLEHSLAWGGLHCEMSLRLGNRFLGRRNGMGLVMPVPVKGREEMRFPVRVELLGKYTVAVGQCWLRDLLGLVRVQVASDAACECMVFPERGEPYRIDEELCRGGISEMEESREKGNDLPEISDLREYIPGDRMRDIHWKVSAKQDRYMVKERTGMQGKRLVTVAGMPGKYRGTEKVLETLFQVAEALLAADIPLCLLLWNEKKEGYEEYPCDSLEMVLDAYAQIYAVPAAYRMTADEERMKELYPSVQRYLLIQARYAQVSWEDYAEMQIEEIARAEDTFELEVVMHENV